MEESIKEKNENNKNRNSNLELLRIISMILIILHHYSGHGGVVNLNTSPMRSFLSYAMNSFGRIGVGIFIIISGYFLINSRFKIKKVISLVLEVYFYSIGTTLIIGLVSKTINAEMIKFALFPIFYSTNMYWFICYYIIIYCLSPFINYFCKKIDKENLKKCILMLTAFVIIIPSITLDNYRRIFLCCNSTNIIIYHRSIYKAIWIKTFKKIL